MKLITETIEDIEYVTEDKAEGGKNFYIEGVFLQSGIKNRNGRMYPEEVMDKEVARYIKEAVDHKTALGELGHPQGPAINLDRVSHRIVSLVKEGKDYTGKAIIANTHMGNQAKGIMECGGKLGVSSRGMGTIKVNKSGINEVQSDFRLATAADIVADPSAPNAWVNGIMENVEWFYNEKVGFWQAAELAEDTKKQIKKLSKKQLEENTIALFSNFMFKISKL